MHRALVDAPEERVGVGGVVRGDQLVKVGDRHPHDAAGRSTRCSLTQAVLGDVGVQVLEQMRA